MVGRNRQVPGWQLSTHGGSLVCAGAPLKPIKQRDFSVTGATTMVKTCVGAALLVLLAASSAAAQNANTDWPAIGHDAASTKYSPLKQITPANVSKLKRAWTYDTGETGGTDEITPIVIGNVMYVATVSQHLI